MRRATDSPWLRLDAPRLCFGSEQEQLELWEIVGYHVALFAAPCPDREGPSEDAAALVPFRDAAAALIVADGVGGGRDAAVAARRAIEALGEAVQTAADDGRTLRDGILDGFEEANRRVAALGTGAATTLIAAEIDRLAVRTYHVGDSQAAVVGQRGKIKLETISHTPPGYGRQAGLLSESEALEHGERHLVLNLIGTPDMRIEISSALELARHDTVVLGSDGLFDNWSIDEIAGQTRCGELRGVLRRLAEATRRRMTDDAEPRPRKPDDLTILLLRRA